MPERITDIICYSVGGLAGLLLLVVVIIAVKTGGKSDSLL